MKRTHVAFLALLGLSSFSACSHSGSPPVPSGSPTPVVSPTATPTGTYATGTVIDADYANPLQGVTVALSKVTGSTVGSPVPVSTTDANGKFTFNASPGPYILVVGPNSPTASQATIHTAITIANGPNPLVLPTPVSEPNTNPLPGQTGLRLATLSSTEADCLSGINAGRAMNALPLVIEDESFLEIARNINSEQIYQDTPVPNPLGNESANQGQVGALPFTGFTTTSQSSMTCDPYTNGYSFTPGNTPYPYSTNSSNTLYGASFGIGNTGNYGVQIYGAP